MDKSPPASTLTVKYSRNTPHMKCTSMRAHVHTHTHTHTHIYAQTQTTAQHKFSPLRTQALSTVDKESEIPKNSERTTFHWKAQKEPTQHRCSHIQRLTVGTTVKKLSIMRGPLATETKILWNTFSSLGMNWLSRSCPHKRILNYWITRIKAKKPHGTLSTELAYKYSLPMDLWSCLVVTDVWKSPKTWARVLALCVWQPESLMSRPRPAWVAEEYTTRKSWHPHKSRPHPHIYHMSMISGQAQA